MFFLLKYKGKKASFGVHFQSLIGISSENIE
jgi:hypothetical protein